MLDPLPCVRRLCDRYQQYSLIQEVCQTGKSLRRRIILIFNLIFTLLCIPDDVYTPTFVDLLSKDPHENLEKLKSSGVKYPFGKKFNRCQKLSGKILKYF